MVIDQNALSELLNQLIGKWEDEVVEFKRAGDGYSTSDIGKYLSALSNEANLNGQERGWLVFGVDNKSRNVVGTSYRSDPEQLQATKKQILDGTGSISFRAIHELAHSHGRVILFEVPAAPRGMPVAWNGHYFGRAGESLIALPQDKLDDIRNQTLATDWTAQVVDGATIHDLDVLALRTARERFVAKHSNRILAEDIAGWSDAVLLDRAKITQDGAITRAALLLLGKPESAYRLSPHPAEITWKLDGEERAYEHFSPPFLLSSSKIFARIRNIQLRLLPENELLAHEVAKYDQQVILEALHNCIAHQDYERCARIVVIEKNDRILLENVGSFFEGQPEDYVLNEQVPKCYRNPFLAQAMTELNMIDHMGYGIHDIYRRQRLRFFPLPDYDLATRDIVRLTIYGREVDAAYSQLLMQQTDLPLADVLALDRVQKHLPITDDAIKHLRRGRLIEGRKPNFHVSARVAAATATMADYVRTRGQDDDFYTKMLTDYLAGAGTASRKQIDDLLLTKQSEALTQKQKINKVTNLLTKLRSKGHIRNVGSRKDSEWVLVQRNLK